MTLRYPARCTRRELLYGLALGSTGAALLREEANAAAYAADVPVTSRYAPFTVGLQSYSLRRFSLDEALARTRADLGLAYWEAYPKHMPVTEDPAVIEAYRRKLRANGITVLAYGVVDFTADEADARRKLAFAKAMAIPTISARPAPEALPLLDRLVDAYGVRIAIHNHGPKDELYGTFDKVLAAIKGHNPRIGACLDTGHMLMADASPLSAVGLYGSRLYDIHLKNVMIEENGKKEFTEIGVVGGALDTVAILRTLKQERYGGMIAIEYEGHPDDPIPYVKKCLDATANFCKTVRTVFLR